MNEKQEYEKKADESFEDYLKRISKIDKLPEEVLKRHLFSPGESFSPLKLDRWIRGCFKGNFEIGSLSYLHPTKDFIEWVYREGILEKWESLGEQRASTADKFVQLVLDSSPEKGQPLKEAVEVTPKTEPTQQEPESLTKDESEKKSIFANASDWENIGFHVSNEGVTIKSGILKKTFKLKEFKGVISDKKAREFLLNVIQTKGVFSKDNLEGPAKSNLKAYVSHLRKTLKGLFGISSDPIKSIGSGTYQTMFSVTSNFSTHQDDEGLNPESNTPPEITRQIESSPPEDL